MKEEKLVREFYALKIIERYLRVKSGYLNKSERPDFIAEDMQLGVEITRAVIQDFEKQMNIVESNIQKSKSAEETKASIENDRRGFSGLAKVYCGGILYSPTNWAYDPLIHFDNLESIITKKTNLLPKYQKCSEYWLFIDWFNPLFEKKCELEKTQDFFQQINENPCFEKAIISIYGELYILSRDGMTHKRMKREILCSLLIEAKKLAHDYCA